MFTPKNSDRRARGQKQPLRFKKRVVTMRLHSRQMQEREVTHKSTRLRTKAAAAVQKTGRNHAFTFSSNAERAVTQLTVELSPGWEQAGFSG